MWCEGNAVECNNWRKSSASHNIDTDLLNLAGQLDVAAEKGEVGDQNYKCKK